MFTPLTEKEELLLSKLLLAPKNDVFLQFNEDNYKEVLPDDILQNLYVYMLGLVDKNILRPSCSVDGKKRIKIVNDSYFVSFTSDGLDYFEEKKKYEKEQKKLKSREWKIAIVSVLIGLIPFVYTLIF